jgi:hypothetical protein
VSESSTASTDLDSTSTPSERPTPTTNLSSSNLSGSASSAAGAKKKKHPLNSSDKVFCEIRDLPLVEVAARLNKSAKRIKDAYSQVRLGFLPLWSSARNCLAAAILTKLRKLIPSFPPYSTPRPILSLSAEHLCPCVPSLLCLPCTQGRNNKDIAQIKDFVGKLSGLQAEHQALTLHTTLSETITAVARGEDFNNTMEVQLSTYSCPSALPRRSLPFTQRRARPCFFFEQRCSRMHRRVCRLSFADLLSSYDVPKQQAAIEDLINQGLPFNTVLRLLIVLSVTTGGLKPKVYDAIRRELLQVRLHLTSNPFRCRAMNPT